MTANGAVTTTPLPPYDDRELLRLVRIPDAQAAAASAPAGSVRQRGSRP